jgi:hypothetical protein
MEERIATKIIRQREKNGRTAAYPFNTKRSPNSETPRLLTNGALAPSGTVAETNEIKEIRTKKLAKRAAEMSLLKVL